MERSGEQERKLRLGLRVLIALVVLTVVEYLLLVWRVPNLLVYLVVINLVDAWLIAEYFMHFSQLWRTEEEHR
ncbi:MAG: hypothetical protein HY660_04060 [Armatimonadetes bacterium]|nr:hypothetical protein [Armatimonadota bacterium]